MKNTWLALTFFGLFWTAIVSVFDGLVGYGFVNQLRALNFAQVNGHITHSEVTTSSTGKGATHGVDIRYHYEVAGQSFEGNGFRYMDGSTSDSDWAHDAIKHYSQGAEATVFYNPKKPSDSVLSPGLDGSNLMWLLFLTPFNAVMLGLWIGGLSAIWRKFKRSPNGDVRFRQSGPLVRVRLPHYPLFAFPIMLTGFIGFIEIFPIGFTKGFHPPMALAELAIFVAYGAGCFLLLWELWKRRSGVYELVIDSDRNTIELPRTFGRKTKILLDLPEIKTLSAESVAHKGRRGGTTYSYVVTLSWRNGDPAQGKLAEWYNESQARQFAEWLRPQLKISSSPEKSADWKSTMPIPERDKDIS